MLPDIPRTAKKVNPDFCFFLFFYFISTYVNKKSKKNNQPHKNNLCLGTNFKHLEASEQKTRLHQTHLV